MRSGKSPCPPSLSNLIVTGVMVKALKDCPQVPGHAYPLLELSERTGTSAPPDCPWASEHRPTQGTSWQGTEKVCRLWLLSSKCPVGFINMPHVLKSFCYGLNICVLPKIHILRLSPQGDALWRECVLGLLSDMGDTGRGWPTRPPTCWATTLI